ncbi:MAG: periplasmic heavy metal sensor [Candidatus Omnitrophota bacterium]|nr:MAG: periplasmic heavy metal sensor [Candidatus Omnitrophota bacterium]
MDTHFRRIMVAVGILALLSVPSVTYAQSFEGGQEKQDRREYRGRKDTLFQDLGLSLQQQEEMRRHRQEHHERAKDLHRILRDTRKKLGDELDKAGSDEATINSLVAEMKELEAQMIDSRVQGVLEIKEILTPEQFQTFQEKTKKMREKKGHRRQHRKDWQNK